MKNLLAAVLIMLAATPAVARPAHPRICLYGTSTDIVCDVTPNDVIVNGHVVGRDPDPRVRAEIRRDAPRIYGY